MALSDATQNPNLAVPSDDALRSIPIAAFSGGELANVNVPTSGVITKYWLDKDSLLADNGAGSAAPVVPATVIAARPSVVLNADGTFASPRAADPNIPGRWRLIP